jgi:hypothetical protein
MRRFPVKEEGAIKLRNTTADSEEYPDEDRERWYSAEWKEQLSEV